MRHPTWSIAIVFVLVFALSGCLDDFSPPPPQGTPARQAQETPRVPTRPSKTVTALPNSNRPVVENTPALLSQPDSTCSNQAAAGQPLDVSVPDGSVLGPGQTFTKTWRVLNSGTCTWTTGYSLVWVQGETFSAPARQPLPGEVKPGESIDLTLAMTAPANETAAPVSFSGRWMIFPEKGAPFGTGENQSTLLMVRVQVTGRSESPTATPPSAGGNPQPSATPAPTSLPPTATPQLAGELIINLYDMIDLDAGEIASAEEGDLYFGGQPDSWQFEPINGSLVALLPGPQAGLAECRAAQTGEQPIPIADLTNPSALCIRTNSGHYAVVRITNKDMLNVELTLDFKVWIVP